MLMLSLMQVTLTMSLLCNAVLKEGINPQDCSKRLIASIHKGKGNELKCGSDHGKKTNYLIPLINKKCNGFAL